MPRIWDIPVYLICDKHLLAEHHELHSIWNAITTGTDCYASPEEVDRWRGCLRGLVMRHGEEAAELEKRGYEHQSWLPLHRVRLGSFSPKKLITPYQRQAQLLARKNCGCMDGQKYVKSERPARGSGPDSGGEE